VSAQPDRLATATQQAKVSAFAFIFQIPPDE